MDQCFECHIATGWNDIVGTRFYEHHCFNSFPSIRPSFASPRWLDAYAAYLEVLRARSENTVGQRTREAMPVEPCLRLRITQRQLSMCHAEQTSQVTGLNMAVR